MKNILLLSSFLFVLLSVNAQISFRTGDSQLDVNLNEINVNASADIKVFNSDLKLSFNVSDNKLEYMKANLNMAPAEMYFALEISKVSQKPVDDVLRIYQSNKKQGWGAIAKQCGIKPGSAEFKQLKSNSGERKNKGKGNGNGKSNSGKNGNGHKK